METIEKDQVAEDLAELKRLIEEGRIKEARRLALVLAARWPDSASIQHFAQVLEPPRAIPTPPLPPGRSFDLDDAWLDEHAKEYPGCWIATYEDRLIAADPSLKEVVRKVRETLDTTRQLAALYYQPPGRE